MRLILTGNCQCGASFNKDNIINDIAASERTDSSFKCNTCKSYLRVSMEWELHVPTKSIAQKLDGKRVDDVKIEGPSTYNPRNLTHTFEDGSMAKILTRLEPCEPYINKATTTSSIKHVRYWKAL